MASAISDLALDEYVCFHHVPWETYEKVLDAIGEYRLRHCYCEGDFEFRRLLCSVEWDDYQKLLVALGDLSWPHTYLNGWLEFMSPLRVHDWSSRQLFRMLDRLCEALGHRISAIGSTTISSKKGQAGFEPDEAFYIQNEPRVRNRTRTDYQPGVDPPPDLIIEVDITHTSLDRMAAFAAAGIPEVWRLDKTKIHFYRLEKGGTLRSSRTSRAFPFLRPADVEPYLVKGEDEADLEVALQFVAHAMKRHRAYAKAHPTTKRRRKD